MRLVLASASPRRAALLAAAGFVFDTVAADVDESCHPGESPAGYVRRLAQAKSARGLRVWAATQPPRPCAPEPSTHPERSPNARAQTGLDEAVVLGADTTVVVDDLILGKPADAADAAGMLRRLSGRKHSVLTGISLRCGSVEIGCVETTLVEFTTMTDADVAWYAESGEGVDKAGAYAIQGLGSRFVTRIDGSYANVVGLPVATVLEQLRRAEWVVDSVRWTAQTE